MAKRVLYFDDRSPPVRACLMLIKMLELDVEFKFIDLFKGEQMQPEFLKLNPAHTVPTLVDNDMILTDSHSILIHLCEISKGNSLANTLLPQEYKSRIRIINMLLFECSILFRRDSDLMSEIVRKGYTNIDIEYHQRKIHEAYTMTEQFLKPHTFLAGNDLTIADLSVGTTLSTVNLMFPIKEDDWPLLSVFFKRFKNLAAYDVNQKGLKNLRDTMEKIRHFQFPNREL